MKKLIIILFLLPFGVMAAGLTEFPKDSTENKSKKRLGTRHYLHIDLGMNNYHHDGTFPDEENAVHSVRPWGSWYVGLTSIQRSHISGGMFLEWGGGISWYNFKFQNDNTILSEGPEGVEFSLSEEAFNYEKSKLTMSHLNLYLVPVYQFGVIKNAKSDKLWKNWSDYNKRGFRIGAGGYVGYRLGSHTKVKYEEEDGDTEKSKNSENFYLENLRYGLRVQMGYKGTDIFINYDLNNLFSENRGPELSAISFGLML